MSNTLNLQVDQGTDFFRLLTFRDQLNAPINLTGFTFSGMARQNYTDPNASFTFSFVVRNQGTNTGEVEFWIYKAQTQGIVISQQQKYYYDIERTSPGNLTDRVMQGQITLLPEATK